MAHHDQGGTALDAEASAAESGRLVYSRCSFDRVTHVVGELFGDHNVDIDDALITAYAPPAETRSVSVGLDRVSLPTIEPRPRPAGRRNKGAPKCPITVAWRMMWGATVTLHERNGDALHTIRYGAMPDDGCESLLHGAAGDVNELLRKRLRLKVCLLSDGAHDLVDALATEVGGRVDREVPRADELGVGTPHRQAAEVARCDPNGFPSEVMVRSGFFADQADPGRLPEGNCRVRRLSSKARDERPRDQALRT